MSLRRLSDPRPTPRRLSAVLASLLAATVTMSAPALAGPSLGDYDGVYQVVVQQTMTISYALPGMPPTASATTVHSTVTVNNGVLLDSGLEVGAITNPSGSGVLRMPFPGLGDCVGPLQFMRDSAGNSRFTGECQLVSTIGAAVTTTVSQSLSGSGSSDSITFTVDARLPTAHRGKAYPGNGQAAVSFCDPPVEPGRLCGGGLNPPPNSPSGGPTTVAGGRPHYTFTIKSGFLPRGLVLNFRTGAITGTPSASNQPRLYKFMVCAYTSIDNRYDACHWTSMKLD